MTKKILLLHGISQWEDPNIFYRDYINTINYKAKQMGVDVIAEEKGFAFGWWDQFVDDYTYPNKIMQVELGKPCGYDLILDRISHAFDFAKLYVNNAMLTGTFVINNQVNQKEDKAFEYAAANIMGIKLPRTVVPINYRHGKFVSVEGSEKPVLDIDLQKYVDMVGGKFPVVAKAAYGGGKQHVYFCKDLEDLYNKYKRMSGLMTIQEYIEFDEFVRCFIIGDKVTIVKYDAFNNKYLIAENFLSDEDGLTIVNYAKMVTHSMGYTINTAEFARSKYTGEWYVIDSTNGACFDMRPCELTDHYYTIILHALVDLSIEYALNPPKVQLRKCLAEQIAKSDFKYKNHFEL